MYFHLQSLRYFSAVNYMPDHRSTDGRKKRVDLRSDSGDYSESRPSISTRTMVGRNGQ